MKHVYVCLLSYVGAWYESGKRITNDENGYHTMKYETHLRLRALSLHLPYYRSAV